MTCEVWTARMGSRDSDALAITRFQVIDPVGQVFAPSAELLVTYLERRRAGEEEAHWEDYVAAYTAEMRVSYKRHRRVWDELLSRPRVVLMCFCKDPNRCHRSICAGLLGKLGATIRGERGQASLVGLEVA